MADADALVTMSPSKAVHTLRVTFAYKAREVRIVASRRVAMINPPSVTPAPAQEQSGYWFEVRSADGALLFHRALHNPVRTEIEVHANDGRRSITRIPVAAPEGEFEVLVPDLPDARSLVLYGTPSGAASPYVPSRELLRIDFDVLRTHRDRSPASPFESGGDGRSPP